MSSLFCGLACKHCQSIENPPHGHELGIPGYRVGAPNAPLGWRMPKNKKRRPGDSPKRKRKINMSNIHAGHRIRNKDKEARQKATSSPGNTAPAPLQQKWWPKDCAMDLDFYHIPPSTQKLNLQPPTGPLARMCVWKNNTQMFLNIPTSVWPSISLDHEAAAGSLRWRGELDLHHVAREDLLLGQHA